MPKDRIIAFIDLFYPPFKRFMPEQTFRYAVCGGSNTLLGFIIYTVCYAYVFPRPIVDFGFYALTQYTASLIVMFLVTFPVGFVLMKFVVFVDSNIRGRVQLFRYFFVFVSNWFLNYILLKIFIGYLSMNGILAQVISTAIAIIASYILQRNFTFKVVATEVEEI